jgi:hypothetical protein
MGMEYPLPVLDPAATGPNILQGVNYASAGAGILNDTGSIFVSFISQFAAPFSFITDCGFCLTIMFCTLRWIGVADYVILLTILYDIVSLVMLSDDHILMYGALPGSP